jgi:hypothetical protein
METAKPVEIVVTNLRRETMTGAKLSVNLGAKDEDFIVPDLAAGKSFHGEVCAQHVAQSRRIRPAGEV